MAVSAIGIVGKTSSGSTSYCLRPSWSRKRCRREAGRAAYLDELREFKEGD
jgi:hypothetical protein